MKKFENGKYVDLTESEICFEEDFKKTDEYILIQIAELKQKLTDTDYIAHGSGCRILFHRGNPFCKRINVII